MFGSGKIQMLQSQISDLNDRLDRMTREKNDLEQKLTAANRKVSELESQLADRDLEQLKEEARTKQAEFEGLKDMYAQKIQDFNDSKEEKEQEFAKEAAVRRHNLENEINDHREASQEFVSSTVRNFAESYNYYLNQIKLLMDALGDVASRTGEALFSADHKDLKVQIGQEMMNKIKTDTDNLRSDSDGLVLIGSTEEIEKQLEEEVLAEECGEDAEECCEEAEAAEEAVEEAVEEAEEAAAEAVEEAEEAVTEAAEEAVEAAEEAAEAADEAVTEAVEAAKDTAVAAVAHSPKIENGMWHVWNQQTNAYVDSGVEAQGPQGDAYNLTEDDKAEIATLVDNMKIHICSASEYDSATGIPTIAEPDRNYFYLVPGGEGDNLYIEWVYLNNKWEQFGSATIDLSNYVQFDDYATTNKAGVVKVVGSNGIVMLNTEQLAIAGANSIIIKQGTDVFRPIIAGRQHESAFYGLAKAAGDITQSQSDNAVGTYTDEAKAAIRNMIGAPALEDIHEAPVQDVQIDGTSIVSDGVANVPIATGPNAYGLMKIPDGRGIGISNAGSIQLTTASSPVIKSGEDAYKPIVPKRQHEATFYGLAKAAGADEKDSMLPVGQYTDTAKTAIRNMIGATSENVVAVQDEEPTDPDTKIWISETADAPVQIPTVEDMNEALAGKADVEDIPEVPVQDVQVNGVSVLDAQGVANVPVAIAGDGNGALGVLRALDTNMLGVTIRSWSGKPGFLSTAAPLESQIKSGVMTGPVISPGNQHSATFYGMAKAAGADMKDIANTTVGTYPDAQKEAIQSMLGISQMLAPTNPNLVASQPYSIGEAFAANGHLYKATAAIAKDEAIIPDTNCVETTMAEAGGKIKDVQVNGTSIVGNDGVANISLKGEGVPTGGTVGQVLRKISDGDYDTEWSDMEVATLEETAEIINNHGMGDDDSMLVETAFYVSDGSSGIVDEGYVYYETDMDASDIAAAYKMGKSLIFKLPATEEEYGIYDDIYMQLVGFEEGDGFDTTIEDIKNAHNSSGEQVVYPVLPRFTFAPSKASDMEANAADRIKDWICVNNKVYFMVDYEPENTDPVY